jgi:hypothetical protein
MFISFVVVVIFGSLKENNLYYSVILTTNAGEKDVLRTQKRRTAIEIIERVNEAIRAK